MKTVKFSGAIPEQLRVKISEASFFWGVEKNAIYKEALEMLFEKYNTKEKREVLK